jgi:putative membrane protein
MRLIELILHGMSNGKSFLFILLAFSFLSQLINVPGIGEALGGAADILSRSVIMFGLFFIVLVLVGVLILAWIASVISSILQYFGFVVRRGGDRIEIEKGLLTHKMTGISVERVQELHVRRPLIRRMIGYAEIRVKMATNLVANPDEKNEGTGVILHPFIKYKEVEGFLQAILPEYANTPKAEIRLPKASLRRSFFRYFRWTFVFLAAVLIPAWFLMQSFAPDWQRTEICAIAGAVFMAFFLFTAYRSWRGRSIAISDAYLVLKRGAYSETVISIPRNKIQIAASIQNPFQRRSRVATISASSGAGSGAVRERLQDVSADQALSYLHWIEPRKTEMRQHT